MKPATSSRPCIESAASWSAAIQPSVRSSSAATSRRREMQAHHLVEVRRRLVGREPQIGGADLDELAAGAQASQRQRRVGAAGDHQVQLRREMVEQEGHAVVDLASVDRRGSRRAPARRRSGSALSSLSSVPRTDSIGGWAASMQGERVRADGRRAPSAARRSRRSRTTSGWLSLVVEREPRRADRRLRGAASHSASSVVLPKPGRRGNERQLRVDCHGSGDR